MVDISNTNPVGGGCSSQQNMVGASEKLVPSTSKILTKTDVYKKYNL